MIKILASFDHEIQGRAYKILMDQDTPISIAKEMALAFLKYLGNIEDQVKAQEEAQKNADQGCPEKIIRQEDLKADEQPISE